MAAYVDKLTAQVSILEQWPIRSAYPAKNEGPYPPHVPEPLEPSVQIAPPQKNYSDREKYAAAETGSPPPSREEEFYEAPEQDNLSQKGEEELPLGAEAKEPRQNPLPELPQPALLAPPPQPPAPQPVLELPNVSQFNFETLPHGHVRCMINIVRHTLCIAENPNYPFLHIILNGTMTFLRSSGLHHDLPSGRFLPSPGANLLKC